MEGHVGNKLYYFKVLKSFYLYWFAALVVCFLVFLLRQRKGMAKIWKENDFLILGLWIFTPLLIYTAAKTKIPWYILPIYSALAIFIGIFSSSILKNKKSSYAIQLLTIIALVTAAYKNEKNIIKIVSNPTVDASQDLIKNVASIPNYRGRKIYICHFEQSYRLCSELYGDLVPSDGGIDGFIKDLSDGTLLFISKDRKEINEIEKHRLKLIGENDKAYIFTK